jgi:hypothetical protein
MKKSSFFLLPLLASILCPLPCFAQAAAAPVTKPATAQELNTYIYMGSIVSCSLMIDQKISYDKAISSAAVMVSSVLLNKHGGKVAQEPNIALSFEQLMNGNIIYIASSDKKFCYPKLSAEDQKGIDNVLESAKKAQPTK